MDRHLAMVRATGLRSARAGSVVGAGWLETGEYDRIDMTTDGDGRVFFVSSILFWPGWRTSFRITISLYVGSWIWCGILHL